MKSIINFRAALIGLTLVVAAFTAQADIVASGVGMFTEPSNALYSGTKSFTVYTYDDVNNPAPGLPGEFTYVYTITNDPGSFISLIGFEVGVPIDSVVSAGFIDDAAAATPPAAAVTNNNDGVVKWDWVDASGLIDPGDTADAVWIISTYLPGNLSDTVVGYDGQFAFDTEGPCVGPFIEPVEECDLEIVKDGCVEQPPPVPGDDCDGKLKSFSFQYTGLGCDASSNLQDPKKTSCTGGADGDEPVTIIIGGKKHGKKHHRKRKKGFESYTDVHVGDVLVVDAGHANKHNFGSSTTVKIKSGHNVIELDKFHTSCSQPFAAGNQFGSLLITSVTSTHGGTTTYPTDPPAEECVTSIDVASPPHCKGKIETLSLRYKGGDCTQTMTTQDSGKVSCVDPGAAGTFPVRIIVSDGASAPPSSTAYIDVSPVNINDVITIPASGAGHSQFTSTTGYWIKNANTNEVIQDGFFHTSCSQPLNLGDQIGALQVFGLDTTEGGSVALGQTVNYTYEVTNPNADDAINVTVDDDKLGNIVTGATIAAGATETYTASTTIEEETTNVATVNGEVNGAQCNEATDTVTITETQPPDPGTICSSKIKAMTIQYTGPDILGARVEIEAKTFPTELVVYDPIDLIGGVTILSKASENGYSIDADAHGETDLGSQTKIRINGVEENIHTSCSTPFVSGQPAPLNDPKGDPSPNWFVLDFTEKNSGEYHHGHHEAWEHDDSHHGSNHAYCNH